MVQLAHKLAHKVVTTVTLTGVAGCTAISLAVTAAAKPLMDIDQYIEVPNCNVAEGTELCPQIPAVSVDPETERMEVAFTANQNHCSDIIAHILVDGREYVSTKVGPGQRDGGHAFRIKAGPHVVGVQAEGVKGGCNTTGTLLAWGGTLHVQAIDNGIGVAPVIDVE
jgi:hypothetical protein